VSEMSEPGRNVTFTVVPGFKMDPKLFFTFTAVAGVVSMEKPDPSFVTAALNGIV